MKMKLIGRRYRVFDSGDSQVEYFPREKTNPLFSFPIRDIDKSTFAIYSRKRGLVYIRRMNCWYHPLHFA